MSFLRALISLGLALALWSTPTLAAPVLVDNTWLAANLEKGNIVIVDMAADGTQYDRFHIPGAIYLPYYVIVKPRKKDRVTLPLPDREMVSILGKFGIQPDHHVVIYDDMGGLNAARLFWALERIGHGNVSVLDGGLVKWILEGRKVVNTPRRLTPTIYVQGNAGRANLASLEDTRQGSASGVTLIDARSIEEYIGDLKKRQGGHVPGAQWWEWSRAVNIAGGFVQQPVKNLRAELDALGAGDKGKPVIVYCRSGHRAARTYLTLRSLGYEQVKLYANSMNEYGRYRGKELKLGTRP